MTYEKVLAVAALCSIMTAPVFFTQKKFNRVPTAENHLFTNSIEKLV
jgi:hypothetical protein